MIGRRGLLAAGAAALAGAAHAARAPAAPWRRPRARDLEGLWSAASYTELERRARQRAPAVAQS